MFSVTTDSSSLLCEWRSHRSYTRSVPVTVSLHMGHRVPHASPQVLHVTLCPQGMNATSGAVSSHMTHMGLAAGGGGALASINASSPIRAQQVLKSVVVFPMARNSATSLSLSFCSTSQRSICSSRSCLFSIRSEAPLKRSLTTSCLSESLSLSVRSRVVRSASSRGEAGRPRENMLAALMPCGGR